MSEWQRVARKAATTLKPTAALAAMGVHDAWLVPLMLGVRLVLVSVVALAMVLSAEKGKRVEAIKAMPPVINALLGRHAR